MGVVLWSVRNGDTTSEIRLEEGTTRLVQDTFSAGPVVVVEVAGDVERYLGDAASVIDAFKEWPQLRTFGSESVCTWAGDVSDLDAALIDEVRLAPPEHWTGSMIEHEQLDIPVNDDVWSASLFNLDWESVATLATEWGAWTVNVFDGWSWTRANDVEECEFAWVGLGEFPDLEVRNLVGNPPNWPGGRDLEVYVESAEPEFVTELTALIRNSEATEFYDVIRLNDIVIFPESDQAGGSG